MNNHYIKRYDSFISSLKYQTINEYSEMHHIIPQSMGGNNDSSNLIRLTARQHFIAHWILARAHKGKMSTAFWYMSNNMKTNSRYKNVRVTSRMYNEARMLHQQEQSKKVLTKEHRQIISKSRKGYVPNELTRQKMRSAALGRRKSMIAIEKQKQTAKDNYKPWKWMQDVSKAKLVKVALEDVDKYLSVGFILGKGATSEATKQKLRQTTASVWNQRKLLAVDSANRQKELENGFGRS